MHIFTTLLHYYCFQIQSLEKSIKTIEYRQYDTYVIYTPIISKYSYKIILNYPRNTYIKNIILMLNPIIQSDFELCQSIICLPIHSLNSDVCKS